MLQKMGLIIFALVIFYTELPAAFDLKKQGKLSLILNGIVVLGLIAAVVYYFLKKKENDSDQE